MEKRTLKKIGLLTLVVLFIGAASLNGYLKGYSNKVLNIANAEDFCKQRGEDFSFNKHTYNAPNWTLCSYSSTEIMCGVGTCFTDSDKYGYENPTTKLMYYEEGTK